MTGHMARAFGDAWVVDRTMFGHAALGRCDCCGGGIAMMAQSPLLLELCTDLDTDDQRKDALAPFPPCMKAEIDRDRLNVRLRLKATLPRYQAFAAEHLDGFGAWWATLSLARKQGICVVPVAEVPVIYALELDVRKAYGILLAAVLEQVRRFPETGYASDGATAEEVAFETALEVKQGAFVLAPEYLEPASSFLDLVRSFVGGQKLLLPHPKRSGESSSISSTETSSFRGDRRLIRVVIARYIVDRAVRQYEKDATLSDAKE